MQSELELGDLRGNRFEIVLREVNCSKEQLQAACLALNESGFVNYYGLQRFGIGGTLNHQIGCAALKGDWKGICDMMFRRKQNDREDISAVKSFYQAGSYLEASQSCPRALSAERNVLEYLSKGDGNYTNDFCGAINAVPKAIKLMWVHAFQSYIWNLSVTDRIEKFGFSAVEGDVVSSEQHLEASSAVHADSFQRVNPTEVANVKILTATDVATGNYSVWDVVLPLPGYDVFLPNHSVKDYFLSLLDSFGLDLDYFKNEAPAPFRLKGAYRRILQRPFDLTWKIIEYDSPDVEIAETEFCSSSAVDAHSSNSDATNVSRKRSIENISTMSNSMDNDVDRKSTHQILGDESNVQVVASRRALSIGFSLSSGSYATMLLRELTKQSMETQYHSGLTASVALEGRADETLDV